MKMVSLFLVYILQLNSLIAQPIDSSSYYYFTKCDYINAIRCYEKKLSIINKDYHPVDKCVDYYNLASSIALCNDIKSVKKAITYLEKSFLADKSIISILFGDANFYSFLNLPDWRSFILNLKERLIKMRPQGVFGRITKDSIFYSLYRVSVQDQALYTQLNCYKRFFVDDSSGIKSVWRIKDSLNSLNQNYLNNAFNQGLNILSISEVGAFFSSKMFLIVQHSDTTMMAKYIPVVKELYIKKETIGENYALLFDRLMLERENGIQYYGTQINPKNHQPYKIKDSKNVNQRRSQLGMIPLESYLKKFQKINK